MKAKNCPYLGLRNDPSTALNFPSEGNCCYHANPVAPIDSNYQAQYCLTENHTQCPIFTAAHPKALPFGMMSPAARQGRIRRILAMVAIPIVVVATAFAINWFGRSAINSLFAQRADLPPESPAEIPASGLFGRSSSLSATPYRTSTPTPTRDPQPVVESCTFPAGWSPYVVKPTDSLFRLSVLYGISVKTLQAANCLGDKSVVLPGDIIYVPEPATNTPTFNPLDHLYARVSISAAG